MVEGRIAGDIEDDAQKEEGRLEDHLEMLDLGCVAAVERLVEDLAVVDVEGPALVLEGADSSPIKSSVSSCFYYR